MENWIPFLIIVPSGLIVIGGFLFLLIREWHLQDKKEADKYGLTIEEYRKKQEEEKNKKETFCEHCKGHIITYLSVHSFFHRYYRGKKINAYEFLEAKRKNGELLDLGDGTYFVGTETEYIEYLQEQEKERQERIKDYQKNW